MSLPPDDVLAAVSGEDPPEGPQPGPEPTPADVARSLIPIADELRASLADARDLLVELHTATPEDRAKVVELRRTLESVRRDAATWVDAIDMAFRFASQRLGGAKQVVVGDGGVVTIAPQHGEWKVEADALRQELLELVPHGVVTKDEIDAVFTTTIEVRADNRRLNALKANRGEAVAEVIDRHRRYMDPDPNRAKVDYAKAGV